MQRRVSTGERFPLQQEIEPYYDADQPIDINMIHDQWYLYSTASLVAEPRKIAVHVPSWLEAGLREPRRRKDRLSASSASTVATPRGLPAGPRRGLNGRNSGTDAYTPYGSACRSAVG
jgi:hypothetical protein